MELEKFLKFNGRFVEKSASAKEVNIIARRLIKTVCL